MKFSSCLENLTKVAGLGEAIKRIATTEIPNTKTWFIGGKKPVSDSLRSGVSRTVSGTRPAVTRRTANGAYDVSALAEKMGIK